MTGGVVSAFQGGAILGTIINIFTGDRLGRKKSVFAGACVSIVGCALQGGAVNMTMLIIGRFIAGVAVGMLTATVPMYAGEMAEAASRGMMSGLLQWMLSWGSLVAQWLGYGCSFNTTDFQCTLIPDPGFSLTHVYQVSDLHSQGAFHLRSNVFLASFSWSVFGFSRNRLAG